MNLFLNKPLVKDPDLLSKVSDRLALAGNNKDLAESFVEFGLCKGNSKALDKTDISRIKGLVNRIIKDREP